MAMLHSIGIEVSDRDEEKAYTQLCGRLQKLCDKHQQILPGSPDLVDELEAIINNYKDEIFRFKMRLEKLEECYEWQRENFHKEVDKHVAYETAHLNSRAIPRNVGDEMPEPGRYVLVWNFKQQMWKDDHCHAGSVSWCDAGMFYANPYWLPMPPAPTYQFACKETQHRIEVDESKFSKVSE